MKRKAKRTRARVPLIWKTRLSSQGPAPSSKKCLRETAYAGAPKSVSWIWNAQGKWVVRKILIPKTWNHLRKQPENSTFCT